VLTGQKTWGFRMSGVCAICGREYKRLDCEFCAREERWDPCYIANTFPPRIRDALIFNKIKINRELFLETILEGNGLFFTGPAGTGKTTMAAQTIIEVSHLRYVERRGPRDFIFETALEILFNLRMCYSGKSDYSEADILKRYCLIDLLAIDDLGVEKTSDWVLQMFHMIIDYRYTRKKPTIITSNKSCKELAERWDDDRITSRINGMCLTIGTNGKDLRTVDRRANAR
jgi:DNA replication protein DnaC